MHGNITGLGLTALIIALSFIIAEFFKGEVKRKIVHIGVSNFAFVYCFVFESDIIPLIGLGCFAVFNYLKSQMEIKEKSMNSPEVYRGRGTVLFPLSIAFLILLKYAGFGTVLSVSTATLCMGYADGLAALAGLKFGSLKMPFSDRKTLVGSITVFATTSVISFLMYYFVDGTNIGFSALLCGLCVTLAECYTPFGLDNVSVPLVCYLICSLI